MLVVLYQKLEAKVDSTAEMEFIGEHSSSDTAGSLWERCARRLPLNNPENLADLQQILNSILTKCLNNPDDPKYFNLKLESKLLQSRVVSREGGLDFLLATGFKSVVKDDEKFLSLLSPNMDDIESAIAWLQDTANTCYSMAASHRNSSKSCCECILQIRLPTAMVVAGGFMKNDKLKDLLSFVRCFFNPDRFGKVKCLCQQLRNFLYSHHLQTRCDHSPPPPFDNFDNKPKQFGVNLGISRTPSTVHCCCFCCC